MDVLVTGGAGFIGSALVSALLHEGHAVRVLAGPADSVDTQKGGEARIFRGDITRPESLSAAFDGVEIVFHLAALAKDWAPWRTFLKVNVMGTENVIQAAERAGAKRLVHMSSLAVHKYRDYFGADETAPRDVEGSFYGESKKLAEEEVEKVRDKGSLETVIIRPALIPYGPRDPARWGRILALLSRRRFAFVRGGEAFAGVIHVEDLARGLIKAAGEERAAGETFVLSDSVPISWKEIMQTLCTELDVPVPRVSFPYPAARIFAWGLEGLWRSFRLPGEPFLTRYRVDVSAFDLFFRPTKAERVLGFRTRRNFSDGVGEMVAWYRRQPIFS